MKRILTGALLSICFLYTTAQKKTDSNFSFVLMSDIHVKPEVSKEFQKVIDSVNRIKPDFVMAAGDLVFDVMRGNPPAADSLFRLYKSMSAKFSSKVYNCIGNHELFGIYPESDVDSSHPDYKWGMFERYLGKTFYSFDHKGWHFIVLNSIDVTPEKKYIGIIGKEQLEWLKKDLANVKPETPVAVTVHIPFLSTFDQRYKEINATGKEPHGTLISNRKEVLDLFDGHNLRLVMQGHLHWIEDIFINNKTHFITAGSVAGRPSWRGTKFGERGFMKIEIKGEEVSAKYMPCR